MKEEREVIRAGRIKFKKGTRTDHRETRREPTAPTGYSNGLGAEAGMDGRRVTNRPAERAQRPGPDAWLSLGWTAAVSTRQLEALSGNLISQRPPFIII